MHRLYTGRRGGYIAAEYDRSTHEEKDNLAALKAFADRGARVVLRGALNDIRTADCTIDGTVWEVKTNRTPTVSAIDNALRSCNGQAENLILNVLSDISAALLEQAFWNRVYRTHIEKIIVERHGTIARTYLRYEFIK